MCREQSLEIAARDGRYEAEAWRVRKDGSRFLANVVIDALRDDSGQLIGFAKITRDITERVRAARELEEARIGLVQSRAEEALRRAQAELAHVARVTTLGESDRLDRSRSKPPYRHNGRQCPGRSEFSGSSIARSGGSAGGDRFHR